MILKVLWAIPVALGSIFMDEYRGCFKVVVVAIPTPKLDHIHRKDWENICIDYIDFYPMLQHQQKVGFAEIAT